MIPEPCQITKLDCGKPIMGVTGDFKKMTAAGVSKKLSQGIEDHNKIYRDCMVGIVTDVH